jgi:outer membrane protein TolC
MAAGTAAIRIAAAVLCAVAAVGARAAEPDAPMRLSLPAALARAAARNPAVAAARARYRAMRERPRMEGALPDPMIGVRYHNEDWSSTFGESDFTFLEIGVEQEIPFPGKRGIRERIAGREAERERAMRDATAAMVLSAVAARYVDLAVAERSGEILAESGDLFALMIEQSSARYAVGEVEQQDVLRAALERGEIAERVVMLDRRRLAAQAALGALLDLESAPEALVSAGLDDPPPVRAVEPLRAKLAGASPELRAAQEEWLRAGEALRLAEREYYPDFAVMAAYMNKERLLPEWEVGVRVSVPLYFWRKQRAAVAEAAHAERAARSARRNAEIDLGARLADLHAMASAAERLLALYRGDLIPQAEATLESARASYGVGRVDFLTTLSAFTSLLEYRLREVEERGNLWRALAEIAPLVGETPLGEPIGRAP